MGWVGWILARPGHDATLDVSNVGLTLMALVAGAACLRRGSSFSGRLRRAWRLLGASALSWGLGMVIWTWYESILGHEVPFPSAADAGFLGAVPLGAAALLTFSSTPRRLASVLRALLDGLVIAASLLFVSWALVLGPVFRAGAESIWAEVISMAYPLGDVILMTIALVALARQRHAGTKAILWLFSGALIGLAVSDSAFVFLTLNGNYVSGSYVDIGWFVGYGVILLAAVGQMTRPVSEADDCGVPGRLAATVPYCAVLMAVITAAVEQAAGNLEGFLVWNALALLVLVVARHVLMLLEHLALLRTLETRVAVRTEELARNEARFRSLVANSSDVVTVVDVDSTIRYQSPSARRVFGHDHSALAGTLLSDLLSSEDSIRFLELLQETADAPPVPVVAEFGVLDSEGRRTSAEMTITNLLGDPNVNGLVLNTRDVSERRRLESELHHQAFHDSLTGLANRALFKDRVEHAISRQRRWRRRVAVLFIDLDDFKAMNDRFGHAYGDQILIAVAGRLTETLRTEDTPARLGGDEFAVLLEDLAGDAGATAVAQRLTDAFAAPLIVDGREVAVTASIGVVFAETGKETADELLRNADLAMYRAKLEGRATYRRYDPSMYAGLVERVELEADLRQALGRGELQLNYQPIVDFRKGRVTRVEALLRWAHPERGLVSPAEFVPLAESSGLIVRIGEWALREACRQVRSWQGFLPGAESLAVSVNMSAKQVQADGLPRLVRGVLEETGLDAGSLTLEMTESIMMEHTEETLATLGELQALGVRLAIDDFGTGYSSLSYLHRLPVDQVKIDRSFVNCLVAGSDEAALATSIVRIGQSLRLETVAEGIETPTQLALLRDMGCALGQGFLFSRPLPGPDFEQFFQACAGVVAVDEEPKIRRVS